METFAIPCAGAIIERRINGMPHILIQTRMKSGGGDTSGKIETPAGKIRAYESMTDAVIREVREETGLTVTEIDGLSTATGRTITPEPFCITQNLSDAYSIILHTFLCRADGNPLRETDESCDIRWISVDDLRRLVSEDPDAFFFMDLPALQKYLQKEPSL